MKREPKIHEVGFTSAGEPYTVCGRRATAVQVATADTRATCERCIRAVR